MKKLSMLAALVIVLAVPAFGAAPDAAPQLATPSVNDAGAAGTQIDIGTWIAAGTDQGMQEAIAQAGVAPAAGCTASCGYGGPSCTGNSNCFEEPNCFIYCDTTGIIRCGTICP